MISRKIFPLTLFVCLLGTFLPAQPEPPRAEPLRTEPLRAESPQVERPLPGQLPRQSRSGGTIFRCLFDKSSDAENNDGWPDHWVRKNGIDRGIPFPEYLEIGNVEVQNNFGGNALRMNMEGGGAAVFSPKIPIRHGMSYMISAYVDAAGVMYDDIYIALAFYGEKNAEPIQTTFSERIRNTNGWQRLQVGPIIADTPGIQSIAVGLLVIPSGRQDFGAKVSFTNVEIRESPTVSLSMPNDNHLFFHPRDIDIGCRIRGVDPALHSVAFTLEDPFGRVIYKRSIEIMIGNNSASQFVVAKNDQTSVFQGTAVWKGLPILLPGFYRVRISTPESFIKSMKLPEGVFFDDPLLDVEPLTFVVMSSAAIIPNGKFGWNLEGWTPEEIESRLLTLSQSGISRLKISAWRSSDAVKERQTLTKLCDTLSRRQFQIIGLLQPIPSEVRKQIKFGQLNAAAIFSLPPAVWSDSIQPTLQDLSLLVKDWQWTSDDDLTIIDVPNFERNFESFRRSFDRNDLGFSVGFAWNWEQPLPERFGMPVPSAEESATPPDSKPTEPKPTEPKLSSVIKSVNEFVALTSAEPLIADDLVQYLAGTTASEIHQIVSLTPLAERDYSLEDRINDLIRRMVFGAIGAEAIFLTKPIDDQTGILRHDNTPNELYLPWRTTATQLTGRQFIGSVMLPNRSRNFNFDCGKGKAVMVVWNDQTMADRPIDETLYLGAEPEILNVWGKHYPPDQRDHKHIIPVTSFPIFVTGLNSNIVRFRLGFQLGVREIPSVTNQKNPITFTIKNDSVLPMTAQVTPISPRPDDWKIDPPTQMIALEAGATGEGTFSLSLTGRANTDRQPIRFDVKTQGPDPQEFSIFDEIQIGSKDVFMEISSQLNHDGDIEVTLSLINNTDKTYTYSCQLSIPTRTMQEKTVRQGFGRTEHIYIVRRGKDLIASGVTEMTVRARPVGTIQPVGQPMLYTVPLLSD